MLKFSVLVISLAFVSILAIGVAPRSAAAKSCGDFASQAEAQAYLRANPTDPDGLDPAHSGIACKDIACPCDRQPFHGTVPTPLPTSTATAVPTATATVPASPTPVDSVVQPSNSVVQTSDAVQPAAPPPPQAPLGAIRPPNTGSAGLY